MHRRLIPLVAALAALAPASASASVTTLDPSYEVITESNVEFPMSDGTVLVGDVYRPKPKADQPADQRFPCLFEMTPYRKELRAAEAAGVFPARGFVYVELDARGTGGSSGQYNGVFLEQEQNDGYDAVEWLATKYAPCDGRVGLFGGSYSGINQYLIASSPKGTPPHLRTLAPQRALSDLYRDIVYTGGIVTASFGVIWSSGTEGYNLIGADPRSSPDPAQAAQAFVDHRSNAPMFTTYLGQPYDSPFYRASSVIDRLRKLDLPIFHLEGWYDAFTRGQMQLIGRLLELERAGKVRGPHYAVVGPWNHGGSHFLAHPPYGTRLIEWYRHWLDDGPRPAWFDEPRISYCEMLAALDGDCVWRHTNAWPLANTQAGRWYLGAGGTLTRKAPEHAGASIGSWTYNPLAGQGETAFSKWDNAAGVPQRDADQAVEDEWKGLTFTTTALEQDLVVTGPIELRLNAITNPFPGADQGLPVALAGLEQVLPPYLDTDFVVKLSDVAPDGRSTLIQTGMLRASHRRLDPKRTRPLQPTPYHDAAHLAPVEAGKPTKYAIEIWPTSKRFAKGHRLRIALYSADTANHLTLLKPVTNTVLAGSQLLLPEPGPAAKKKAKPKRKKKKKKKKNRRR
jgi:putative CocE/NonD family hydrolase